MMYALATVVLAAAPGLAVLQAVSEPGVDFCVECCSLYCAAAPTLTVSNHLAPQGGNDYGPPALEDGAGGTAWVVRSGVGEWFEFAFEASGLHPDFAVKNDRVGVNSLALLNGYNKSEKHWRDHSRIRQLRLAIDGRDTALINLLDQGQSQRVDLPPALIHPGTSLRFTITRTFPGARFDETALSEARLDGYGHH